MASAFSFTASPTPDAYMKTAQRALSRSQRELAVEQTKMERQEKVALFNIKKEVEAGKIDLAKLMAKDLVRTRNIIKKFYTTKMQLQSVATNIQGMKVTNAMALAMKSATAAIVGMNRQVSMPAMMAILREFEKQNDVMETKQEMMDDTVNEAADTEGDEQEQTDILAAICDEVGLKLTSRLDHAFGSTAASGARNAAVAAADSDAGVDLELQRRLDRLQDKN